jgi:hypothetical protein
MKIVGVALLAGLGTAAMALPALGSPAAIGGPDSEAGKAASVQVAQLSSTGEYSGRSEERGGNFKKKKKMKSAKKR